MIRPAPLAGLAFASLMMSGCVAAAAIPVATAGAFGVSQFSKRGDDSHAAGPASPSPPAAPVRGPGVPPPGGLMTTQVSPAMQYLYGSAEVAASQRQTYLELANFLIAKASDKAAGRPVKSVVLAPGATFENPVFEPCGDKPLAVVLDADETMILNYGFESDEALRGGARDQQRWGRWEQTGQGKVRPVPGALDALEVARNAGVAVVVNSNRTAAGAAATAATLAEAGLGKFTRLDTLWLQGDAGSGPGKDARRWAISARYCVIALVGDQLGDFSDLFNAPALDLAHRRAAIGTPQFEIMWGQGWFILPNPVYGTAIRGDYGAIFPEGTRWSDPADAPAPVASGSAN